MLFREFELTLKNSRKASSPSFPVKCFFFSFLSSSFNSAILSTAKEIKCYSSPFEPPSTNDAADLWREIFFIFNLDKADCQALESDWRYPALRSMLCYAVSEACDKREEYIPRILALSVGENSNIMFPVDGFNVQRILMKIISRGMVTEPERISESEDQHIRNDMLLHETEADINLLNYNSREEDRAEKSNDERTEARYDKMNNFTWRMKEDNIILRLEQELKLAREENEILKTASYDASKRENELSIEVESLKANYRLWTLKEEAAFLDRERLLKEKYESDIKQLKSQLDDLSKRCEEGDRAKAELATLKDDLDVLQHLETKLLLTEDQLRKYKDKLQEFSDVRTQLSREEEAHGKAVEQILLLESELAQLQPLKRQLEVYRARATDAEVKLAQCQHSLEKVQHLSKHLALENTELATTSKARINETEQLRQKLECPTSEDSLISSLGEGFRYDQLMTSDSKMQYSRFFHLEFFVFVFHSELNPALKEEIIRLRSENQRLILFVSKHTEAAVIQLEEKLDDAARLADSFKKQYLHTLTQLEVTQHEFQNTLEVVSRLETEITEWSQKFTELECVLSGERAQNLEARKAAEDKFEQETRDLLEKAASELAEKESLWNDLLESERNDAQNSLDAVFNKLKETTDRYNYEISQLREETRVLIETEKQNSSAKIQQLMLEHSQAVDVFKQEAANEREELMKKGKAMITSKKEKAENLIKKLNEDHDAELSRMKTLYANFCEKQIAYEEKVTKKITSYKAKLDVANGKISFLETEIDNLQLQQQGMEKEKQKANEEAERLRRLVGSRMGAESDLELSFEKLRQEYSAMLEEHRFLKRQVRLEMNF